MVEKSIDGLLSELEKFPAECIGEPPAQRLNFLQQIESTVLIHFRDYSSEDLKKLYFGIKLADLYYRHSLEKDISELY